MKLTRAELNHLCRYCQEIQEMFTCGEAREESYYSILERFIDGMSDGIKGKEINVIIKPRSNGFFKPDFMLLNERVGLIGCIEAKIPGKNLDLCENEAQMKRYFETYPNLILTDFLEFRFYNFQHRMVTVCLGTLEKGSILWQPGNEETFYKAWHEYFNFSLPHKPQAREMVANLARRTRFIKEFVVMPELEDETGNQSEVNHFKGFYQAFKTYLIHELSKEEFADIYAQALTYGLFIASIRGEKVVADRRDVIRYIPRTSGILRDMFEFLSLGNIPRRLESCIKEIIDLLPRNPYKFFKNHFRQCVTDEDPVIHFYETFLAEYDPQLREKRGVYYTPTPVVNYIIRSVHVLLKERLGRRQGLAEDGVNLLDPAAGTAAFLAAAAQLALQQYEKTYGRGGGRDFIRYYLKKNLYGFEEMIAPYAIAHLQMTSLFKEKTPGLTEGDRLNIYLTNTLDMEEIEQSDLPGMSSLSNESRLAGKVKKEIPVTVVVGNPPYSGHSMNHSETWVPGTSSHHRNGRKKVKTWIGELIEDYKKIDGEKLSEKNLKWLQDDYVKFIRFAQATIERNGEGIVGYITNHSYLDNPTFRGMRKSLLDSFDEIYILDLHGNALKKERCPDGSRDENIFDIRQGVAITFMVKKADPARTEGKHNCQVFHAELWGERQTKYEVLTDTDWSTTPWRPISPGPGFYLFTPGKMAEEEKYWTYWSVTDIFPVHSVGIVTARDHLTIKDSPEEMLETAREFATLKPEPARRKFDLGEDTRDWKVEKAQEDIRQTGMNENQVVRILYRPFDHRYTYYTGNSRGFLCMPRAEVMKHMLKENLGLITVRQVAEGIFNHCLITDSMVDSRITTSNKGIGYLFPLYLYPYQSALYPGHSPARGIFKPGGETCLKQVNLMAKVIERVKQMAGYPGENREVSLEEEILYYIYGILFCPAYRLKYERYLKIDFPRIPFPCDYYTFNRIAAIGQQLVALHLMKSPRIAETASRFEVEGNNIVTRAGYVPFPLKKKKGVEEIKGDGRIYINDTQYFSQVPAQVWEYKICGYQVMDKWMKDRRGQALKHQDICHYIKMASCLELTIRCQEELDREFTGLTGDKTV